VDLAGKHVSVIGTGASATQFVPEIVDKVASLKVYQRTPPWLLPTPRYHEPISDQQRWLFENVPFYERWFRLWTFRVQGMDGALPYMYGDESWDGGPGAVSAANAEIREILEDYIKQQLEDRPDLLAHSIPAYPPGGNRPLRDCGVWLEALKKPHVELVTTPIDSITPAGVRTSDGVERDADVLIYGTGFQADHFLWPMTIRGRDGITLEEAWSGNPRAFKGITMPRFPNLFCLYGPNTNIVVGTSIIFFTECQLNYVMECFGELLRAGETAMEVKQSAHDNYNEMIDEGNARMAWGAPQVKSWYKNAKGRVTQNWPGTHLEYWEQTRSVDRADYDFL
jgi:4-hydroxyacetophenone monooxygenase